MTGRRGLVSSYAPHGHVTTDRSRLVQSCKSVSGTASSEQVPTSIPNILARSASAVRWPGAVGRASRCLNLTLLVSCFSLLTVSGLAAARQII